jgi:hypothetical protein
VGAGVTDGEEVGEVEVAGLGEPGELGEADGVAAEQAANRMAVSPMVMAPRALRRLVFMGITTNLLHDCDEGVAKMTSARCRGCPGSVG